MATSVLFSQDMTSSYSNTVTAAKQPLPRTLPETPFTSTTDNHINHWLSQQHSQRSYMECSMPRTMSNINTSFSHSHEHAEDEIIGYTFTTQAPSDDPLGLFPTIYHSMHMQHNGPSAIQQSHLTSPAFSEGHWSDPSPYVPPNEHASQSYLLGNYSQEPINGLNPFMVTRTPASHMSPAGSDPSLSPLYSASSRLPTPTTPGSPSQPFNHSPTMNDDMNLLVMDSQAQGSSDNSHRRGFTHREQLQLFRDVVKLPMDGAGPFVPQMMYKPHTTSDRKRYVEEVMLDGPLYFFSDHPSQSGILLKDALQSRTKRLRDRDQVVFEGRGPSVSIRLEWPGYRQWSRQIPTKDFRSPPGPITLAKLAKNVAKCVQRFMQDRKSLPMEEEADQSWRIGDGPHDIKLEDLMLVSIHHVSLGSWQPHLRLMRPRTPRHAMALPPTPLSTTNTSPASVPYTQLS